MLILEGADGSGKTSLASAIRTTLAPDLPLVPKIVGSDARPPKSMKVWTDEHLAAGFQYRMYDRFPLISDSIYAPVLGRAPFLAPGAETGYRYSQFYNRVDPIIIYCLPPFETVWANIQREDTDNSVVNDLGRARQIYDLYRLRADQDYSRPGLTMYVYDYTQVPLGAPLATGEINELIRELQSRAGKN